MKKFYLALAVILVSVTVVLVVGCCSVLYPPGIPGVEKKTVLSGIVVDGQGQPISNATVEASWNPVGVFLGFPPPTRIDRFSTDNKGAWQFSTWGAERLYVKAEPPSGYRLSDAKRLEMAGPFLYGFKSTNTIVLQLERLSEPGANVK